MIQKRYQDQYDYILRCIHSEDEVLTTPEEKLRFFVGEFHREYDNEERRKMWPNRQERIAEYLQAIPGCCSVAYGTWHIGNIGEEWGIVKTEKQRERFVENWWSCLAFRIIQLCEHYGIEFPAKPYSKDEDRKD